MDNNAVWLIILLPILGFLIQGLAGPSLQRKIGKKALGVLAVLPIAASFVLGLMLTQGLASQEHAEAVIVSGGSWINIMGLNIPFEWVVDPLSMTMVLIITGVGALIHLYSTAYMAEEKDFSRFFAYLNLFVAAMLVLVLGNNLPLLFIGWEGVGLCSYLLIGFWYTDTANTKAANKAFIVNRVGDWSLMLGLFLIVVVISGANIPVEDNRYLSYDAMLPALTTALKANPAMATAIALLLFGGAAGKSAQFPLYVWLPDAMAGPTPVSALIHAATMVTSGVVLLNRMNIVFQLSPTASAVVCAVGAFTALFAAIIAFGQTDIKKVLAYSTVSQLGFMFIACGAGAYWAGMFHVTTHAFFKALLFLGAGAVIHAMSHEQDMRHYGKLAKYLPITFGTMMVGTLAIAGVPGLSGYYSKEAILGSAIANSHAGQLSAISGWVGLGVAALTAMYMGRLAMLTFFGKEERWRKLPVAEHHDHEEGHDDDHGHALTGDHKPKEVPVSMWLPLVVLAVLSAGAGLVLNEGKRFEHWLYPSGLSQLGELKHEVPNLEIYSYIAAGLGLLAGVLVYIGGLPAKEGLDETKWARWRRAAANQFGFDALMTNLFAEGGRDVAIGTSSFLEDQVIDGAVEGSASGTRNFGGWLQQIQTGAVRLYAMLMLLGGVGFVGYFLFIVNRGGK